MNINYDQHYSDHISINNTHINIKINDGYNIIQ